MCADLGARTPIGASGNYEPKISYLLFNLKSQNIQIPSSHPPSLTSLTTQKRYFLLCLSVGEGRGRRELRSSDYDTCECKGEGHRFFHLNLWSPAFSKILGDNMQVAEIKIFQQTKVCVNYNA